jgi:two-component system, NtrC family, sensor histidine kinase HydH
MILPMARMTPTQKYTERQGRQFRLVKFFAYASFIVLIIFSFPFSMVISRQAKDILMKSYENYALLLGENLNYQVFQNFVLPVTSQFGKIRLREQFQYELMDRIVKNTTHSFKIDLVNIYDINNGVIAYSTDPSLLGKKVQESLEYKKAVMGENSSRLISGGDTLWGLGIEKMGGKKNLRTYLPFTGIGPFLGDTGYVLGVFELIQDLSEEYKSVIRFQYLTFGLSILIMAMIFVALLLIVRKAERIIDERAGEQRELEAQLHHAERLAALGKMVAGVSHEIRNPLGIIRSTAELLGSMPGAQESTTRLTSLIIEESGRLNDIVTEFLDFARPMTPNFQKCNLKQILERTFLFIGPELAKKGISLQHNLDHSLLQLQADPEKLYRSFLNIFLNAIQSMPNGGEITVHVTKEKEGRCLLKIADTGTGISEKDLDKIFDPFYSAKEKGTGLGLSIVRNIIEAHKGKIWIESRTAASESEGPAGTRVMIQLPTA